MPAIAAITVLDGQATPVGHVFTPQTTNGSKATWVNRAGGALNAYEKLDIEIVQPKSATGAYRMIGSMTRPILGVVNGVSTVIKQEKLDFTLNFAPTSTSAERKDDITMLAALLSNATVKGAAENVEPFY
jgi:hypothetical protein